ncbi:hypothetical protein F4803DRAFT_272901 [Xylaria telfairii]|nr:hypothetical protein F4803DRAFT_272901 [Xylaria telfairii]
MYSAFNWAYEAKGSSGFIEYASNPSKPSNVVETVNAVRPGAVPNASRASISSNKRTSIRLGSYRDIGVNTDLGLPSEHQVRREVGGDATSLQVTHRDTVRPLSMENGVARSRVGRRDRRFDEDDSKKCSTTGIVLCVLICEQFLLTHIGEFTLSKKGSSGLINS